MDGTSDKKSGNQHSPRKDRHKRRKKLPHKERWTAEKSDMQYHGSKFHSAEW